MYKVTLFFKEKVQVIKCKSIEHAQHVFNESGANWFRVIQGKETVKEKKK